MVATELRTALLANGYVPLPNICKVCMLQGWPTILVNEGTIDQWNRRYKRFPDTGLRIEGGLAVFDIDIDDQQAIDAIARQLETDDRRLLGTLVRYGKGAKEAWFFRIDEPFGRITTRRWLRPGDNLDLDGAHSVEAFGGASPRQFGAFGAHTRNPDGSVEILYRWAKREDGEDLSPATVRFDELPVFTKADIFGFMDICERVLDELRWTVVTRVQKGEVNISRVFDLTDDMVFDCNDGVNRTLAELEAVAGEQGLRCSASWLEPGATNRERCIVGWSRRHGSAFVWESAQAVTHLAESAKPLTARELAALASSITSPWAGFGGTHGR